MKEDKIRKNVNAKEVSQKTDKEIKKSLKKQTGKTKRSVTAPAINAMCYILPAAPFRNYTCSEDNFNTLYADETDPEILYYIDRVTAMRALNDNLNFLAKGKFIFLLDETLLCAKHFPKAKKRFISLLVKSSDKKETRTNKIKIADLNMLAGYFANKEKYSDEYGFDVKLQSAAKRINELLREKIL